jgi:hypothetical protein
VDKNLQRKFVGQTHKKRPDELGVIVEVGVGGQHRLAVPALLQKDPVVFEETASQDFLGHLQIFMKISVQYLAK